MAKGIAVVVLLLVIGAIFMFFVLPFMGVSLFASKPEPSPSVTILQHSGAVDTRSATYIVQGTAKNTGTVPVVKVYIVVTTYDANGAEIGSAYDALLNLNPGDEAPFRVEARPLYQGIRVARYNVVPNYNAVPGVTG
ncbi:MAG: FxLYD domain-containing protein [Methanomicrobiales archaeon]|nr:FxLYD domain-containing protein [Methanomicrobiales archaeon]